MQGSLAGEIFWAQWEGRNIEICTWMEAGMAGGEASRVEPAEQADLGVYGVGESPSFPSPGPCRGPDSTHHSEGPLDGSWDLLPLFNKIF